MVTDRGAVLSLRAAARGVVDFSKARLTDVKWWRRANALIERMALDDDRAVLDAAFRYQLALVACGALKPEDFGKVQKTAVGMFQDLVNAARPWASTAEAKQNEFEGMIDAYKRLIGDPGEPEFRKKMAADLDRLAALNSVQKVETEDERIDRLMREREALYALKRKQK